MFSKKIKALSRTAGFQITLWHAGTFVLAALIVFISAYFLLRRTIDEQTEDTIEFRLNQFASEYARGGIEAVIELSKLRKGRAQKAFFVRIANQENKTVFLRDADDWSDFRPDTLEGLRINQDLSWTDLVGSDGVILRIVSDRLKDGYIIQVGKTLELRRELLRGFQTSLVLIVLIVVVGGIIGGTISAARTLRPIQHLTTSVQSILDTGKFDSRVPSEKSGNEIVRLVDLFNEMIEKIDRLIRSMRDSLDNVAHDLRTPMTRLRNVAARAIEQDADKASCHEALGDCLEESERAMTMLFTLMDIAEAESGVMKLERNPISVSKLLFQAADLYEHVAEERRVKLDIVDPGTLSMRVDSGRLQRALGNLIDNAIKYTPEEGKVQVSARREDNCVIIDVRDTGVGIPESEIPRIWDRLYRVDKSRSQRGLGLGLSFVKAIVEAHEGFVTVESRLGQGSKFTIRLPM